MCARPRGATLVPEESCATAVARGVAWGAFGRAARGAEALGCGAGAGAALAKACGAASVAGGTEATAGVGAGAVSPASGCGTAALLLRGPSVKSTVNDRSGGASAARAGAAVRAMRPGQQLRHQHHDQCHQNDRTGQSFFNSGFHVGARIGRSSLLEAFAPALKNYF